MTFAPNGTLDRVRWVAARHGAHVASAFLLNLIIARYLGPEDYGQLSLFLSIVLLVLPVATLGLDKSLLREFVLHPQQARGLLRTAIVLRLLSGAIGFLLATGAFYALEGWNENVYRIGLPIALTLFFGVGSLLDYFFHSQQRFHVNFFAVACGSAVALLVAILLIVLGAGLAAFAWLRAVEVGATALVFVLFFVFLSRGQLGGEQADTSLRELFMRSWPFLLSAIAVGIYARLDQVMIGSLSTYEELGYYSAAVKMTEVWYLIPSFIITAMGPSILRLRGNDQVLKERMSRLYQAVGLIGIVGFGFNALLANRLVPFIFGGEFSSAIGMLVVLSITILFAGMGGARTIHILARGHDRIYAFTTILGMALNVLLNFILIPRFGGIGAAWATLGAQFVAVYASCFVFPQLRSDGVLMTRAFLMPKDMLNWQYLRRLLSVTR